MQDGVRTTISAASEAEYYAKARAIKAGLLEKETPAPKRTLDSVVQEYIASRALRSPSTVLGYKSTWEHRFTGYHNKLIENIDFQDMINREAVLVSPKTLANAWGIVRPALKMVGYPVSVVLPTVPKSERQWLSSEEIPLFLDAVKGKSCELPALLALHSLRASEIAGLKWADLDGDLLHVHASVVRGEAGAVEKPTLKNKSSDRYVRIFIPRLLELLNAVPVEERTGAVVQNSVNKASRNIKAVCISAGLPSCSMHCLRHSFATLCHRLNIPILEVQRMGGWSDYNTLREIYTHLDSLDAAAATSALSSFYDRITTGNSESPVK